MKKLLILAAMLFTVMFVNAQTISFGNSYVKNNKTYIPIIANGFDKGMCAISLTSNYDTTLFDFQAVEYKHVELNKGFSLYNDINDKIIFGWYSLVNGDPSIFPKDNDTLFEYSFLNKKISCGALKWDLTYTSNCDVVYYEININNFISYNITLINKTICTPNITNPQGYKGSLNGEVTYYNVSFTPLENVIVKAVSGTKTYLTTTDSCGLFEFINIPIGTYTVSVNSNNVVGGINTLDAREVSRHTVGIIRLTGPFLKAADVSADNKINSLDASIISKYSVGIINSFPAGKWYFETKNVGVAKDVTKSIIIYGIVIGDVNASFIP